MRLKNLTLALSGLGLLLLLAACSLSTSPAPPTLVPRATDTPLPTIGYATLDPQLLPTAMPVTSLSITQELSNLTNQVESDRLLIHIDALQKFYTRHVNSSYLTADRGIGAAYQYILTQFQAIQAQSQGRFTVTNEDFSLDWAGIHSTPKNVVGILNGTEIGGGVIVLGAHYDSRIGNLEDGRDYAPGADDNGSGIAALIEIARILSQHPHGATIVFVAFSAEEVGRLGSVAFVHNLIQAHNIPVTAMLDMDIIGSSTGADGTVNDRQIRLFAQGPDTSPSRQLARDINFIGDNYVPQMEIVVQDVDDRSGSYGDHLSFSKAGYPAVRFTEMNEEPQRRHTERDTTDDIQADYLVKATQTILVVITALADGPLPPHNMALRDNGNGTRRLVWETVPNAASYMVLIRPVGSPVYQQFPMKENFVDWDGFVPERYTSLAIVARDATGLMGFPSAEYLIGP